MADKSRQSSRAKNDEASPKRSVAEVKREPEEVEEDESAPQKFWATMGLCPVGTVPPPRPSPPHPLQKLNARGMPARIRKKNKLFFDDNIVNAPPPRSSPKRGPKLTPVKSPSKLSMPLSNKKIKSPMKSSRLLEPPDTSDRRESSRSASPDRKTGQRIGMRLRNLLKLPKAHRWVCCEHFYSNIDKALLAGENDFRICLRESFPKLIDRNLTQVQWTKIRRIMGKPRRCSQAFFNEERRDLDSKRQKIRFIQQRHSGYLSWKDLPNEIPMQLIIGTKVTARLRKPQDGLYTGTIEGVDLSNNTYRVNFERPGLGTHSVPDYEVLSNEPPDTINLSAMAKKSRPKQYVPGLMSLYHNTGFSAPAVEKSCYDPVLSSSTNSGKFEDSTIGAYPVKFLESVVRITKILCAKKEKIIQLRQFNSQYQVSETLLTGARLPDDFERRYASVVLELERMNLELKDYLNKVQIFCHEIAPGLSMAAMLAPSHLREKCRTEAESLVLKHNTSLIGEKHLDLIIDLTALLLQVKSLSDSQENAYELYVLQGTMQQIKSKLQTTDQIVFQNCVEIHMQRIQSWLGSPGLVNSKESVFLEA